MPSQVTAKITITAAAVPPAGMLVSLETSGDYSDQIIDRRFYSIAELPPDDLAPHRFWGQLLQEIGGFLNRDD